MNGLALGERALLPRVLEQLGIRTKHKRQEGITEILTRRGLFIMPREVFAYYRDEGKLDSFYSPEWQRPQKTYLEHNLIGSSVDTFFGYPFMGDYRVDREWQEQVKQGRSELLGKLNDDRVGFVLYQNPDFNPEVEMGTLIYDGVKDWFGASDDCQDENMRKVLERIFFNDEQRRNFELARFGNKGVSLDFPQFDYVRLNSQFVPYNNQMVAVPNPVSLDFVKGGQVIHRVLASKIPASLKPSSRDVYLAGIDHAFNHGQYSQIRMSSRNGVHELDVSDADKSDVCKNWFDVYKDRVSRLKLPVPKLLRKR